MCSKTTVLVMLRALAIAVPCTCILLIESLWFRRSQRCTPSGHVFASDLAVGCSYFIAVASDSPAPSVHSVGLSRHTAWLALRARSYQVLRQIQPDPRC